MKTRSRPTKTLAPGSVSRQREPLAIARDGCPRCGNPFSGQTPGYGNSEGVLACSACGSELCSTTLDGHVAFAAISEVCTFYGFDVKAPRSSELAELLRAELESSSDRSVLWAESDEPNDRCLLTSGIVTSTRSASDANNPYAPPRCNPQRSGQDGDAYVFSAIVSSDLASLRWNVTTYAKHSDVYALLVLGMFFGLGFCIYLLEDWFAVWFANGRILIASVAAVIVLPLVGRIAVRPYANRLLRRASRDGLFAEDAYQVEMRQHTLSAWNSRDISTWRLADVRHISGEPHLLVLRVEPKRQLYLNANSQTNPESFVAFQRGIKRRLRKTHWLRLTRGRRSRRDTAN